MCFQEIRRVHAESSAANPLNELISDVTQGFNPSSSRLPLEKAAPCPFCAGKCRGRGAWNVKLHHRQAFPSPLRLALIAFFSLCVLVPQSIFNLQKEGPPAPARAGHLSPGAPAGTAVLCGLKGEIIKMLEKQMSRHVWLSITSFKVMKIPALD